MYLIERGLWQMAIESEAKRKKFDVQRSSTVERADKNFHEDDLNKDIHFNSVSEKPNARGPIFSFNDTYMEMRCGGSEEKRGIITMMTLGSVGPMTYAWLHITFVLHLYQCDSTRFLFCVLGPIQRVHAINWRSHLLLICQIRISFYST